MYRAISAIRGALVSLDKPRWWRAAIALGRLREKGQLHEWVDVEWAIPPGSRPGRQPLVHALADVFGGPAPRVINLDSKEGQDLHYALGEPDRVLVDVGANVSRRDELQIAAVTGVSGTDRSVWVAADDPALAWVTSTEAPKGSYQSREYNPNNDLRQQQGLKCAFPLKELTLLGRDAARALIGETRRNCPYLVLNQRPNGGRQPTCSVNGEGCSYKAPVIPGETAWGTGGPKVLLELRVQRPSATAPPRSPGDPPTEVEGLGPVHSVPDVLLGPEWSKHLRRAMVGDKGGRPPAADDVAVLLGWLQPGPAGPLARPRDLAKLIGEDVLLQTLAG